MRLATHADKEYVNLAKCLAGLCGELAHERAEVDEHHVLKLYGIDSVHTPARPRREEAAHRNARTLVLSWAGDGERGFIAIRHLLDAVGIRIVVRDERDVGAKAHGGERATLCNRVEDECQVAKGDFEALPAVVGDDHNTPILPRLS